MSAEELVEQIIDQALEIGTDKAEAADDYAQDAVRAASGTASLAFTPYAFNPNFNLEPQVTIPKNATGVDGALFNSTQNKIIQDLSDQFAAFFVEYFPNECDYMAKAQQWLCDTLENGGTGINAAVEDQIWQRERSRILRDGRRARDEVVKTFASRGFPLPPGAMQHQIHITQQVVQEQTAEGSRARAIQQAEIEIENVRFCVEQALNYRVQSIQAAGDYIRTLALGPQIAVQLATSSADAQAKLIGAASSYFNSRIRLEEMRMDVAKTNATLNLDAGKTGVNVYADLIRSKASTIASVAQSLGAQAAAALNAVHASAAIAVQGEADDA
jgi:hypothetical protein